MRSDKNRESSILGFALCECTANIDARDKRERVSLSVNHGVLYQMIHEAICSLKEGVFEKLEKVDRSGLQSVSRGLR